MKKATGNPDPPVIGDLPKKNRRNLFGEGTSKKGEEERNKKRDEEERDDERNPEITADTETAQLKAELARRDAEMEELRRQKDKEIRDLKRANERVIARLENLEVALSRSKKKVTLEESEEESREEEEAFSRNVRGKKTKKPLSKKNEGSGHVKSGEKTGGPPSKPKYYLMTDSGAVL